MLLLYFSTYCIQVDIDDVTKSNSTSLGTKLSFNWVAIGVTRWLNFSNIRLFRKMKICHIIVLKIAKQCFVVCKSSQSTL